MTFPCTSCGLCCRHARAVVDRYGTDIFPHAIDEDGVCSKLDRDTNLCKVYAVRPLVCNVDAAADVMRKDRVQWYRENASACNALQTEAGLPESYRVVVD